MLSLSPQDPVIRMSTNIGKDAAGIANCQMCRDDARDTPEITTPEHPPASLNLVVAQRAVDGEECFSNRRECRTSDLCSIVSKVSYGPIHQYPNPNFSGS